MNLATRLRDLLAGDRIVMAQGAVDALTARLVEQVGFPAVYMRQGSLQPRAGSVVLTSGS